MSSSQPPIQINSFCHPTYNQGWNLVRIYYYDLLLSGNTVRRDSVGQISGTETAGGSPRIPSLCPWNRLWNEKRDFSTTGVTTMNCCFLNRLHDRLWVVTWREVYLMEDPCRVHDNTGTYAGTGNEFQIREGKEIKPMRHPISNSSYVFYPLSKDARVPAELTYLNPCKHDAMWCRVF